MKEILVIQHTESVHHKNGMVGAQTDWNLTERGKEQAESICNAIKDELTKNEYVLFASDLKRAVQTAEPLLPFIKGKPFLRKELREIDEGEATGKSREWYNQYKTKYSFLEHYSDNRAFPGAESYMDLWRRTELFMKEVLISEYDRIIIVSHSITLHLFFGMWVGMDLPELKKYGFWAMAAGVSKLIQRDDGRREIAYLNNLSYQDQRE